MRRQATPHTQAAAVLPIALILLTVVTLLAIGGMRTATLEFAIARHETYRRAAFEAAETGVELLLARTSFNIAATPQVERTGLGPSDASVSATARFVAATRVPAGGFSLGVDADSLDALHFEIESTGTAASGTRVTHRQGFYVLGYDARH